MGAAFLLMLVLVFFGMPETAYHRSGTLNIDGGQSTQVIEVGDEMLEVDLDLARSKTSGQASVAPSDKASSVLGLTTGLSKTVSHSPTRVSGEQRISYWKELLPYNG